LVYIAASKNLASSGSGENPGPAVTAREPMPMAVVDMVRFRGRQLKSGWEKAAGGLAISPREDITDAR